MRGQAEIVIRREIDDLLAVEGADRGLLVIEHAQLEVGALLLEFVELIGKKGKWIGSGSCSHEISVSNATKYFIASVSNTGFWAR